MTVDNRIAKLEDYGIRNATTPQERLTVYQDQTKALSPKVRAKFWLGCMENDPEVKQLILKGGNPAKKKRSRKPENVPIQSETPQIEENGVCQ